MARRGSAERWWLAMGVLMMVFAYCRASAGEVTTDDDEIMARQTRGLVLRSWRNSQQQAEQSSDKNPSSKVPDPILPMPKEAMVFSGLPISMKLVLLQRLAGYDKRTPNSRAFLGMRGKKSSSSQDNAQKEEEDNQPDMEGSSEGDKIADLEFYGLVPEKRKMHGEKFLGMRGKKMANGLAAGTAFIPNWRERYVYQQPFQKKREPSSNSFMGMRGKRSEAVIPTVVLFNEDEQPIADSKISHRLFQERFQSK
ncbi:hypothetical protein OUZ56_013771 [Daphnia magna]|uniref:Tachykinin n=2 Tax=Daphnia magna TaxID=35525 RepID=A0ABQ9Z6W3_9CRUS|nr:hypothetical protein OUZ56_013771 [Daphnia magna]